MKKLTYIIVDDDQLAHNVLAALNSKHDFIECVGSCYDSFKAMSIIMEKKPDFLFLDIEMPGMSGIDLLEIIDKSLKVIVTSSYTDYAEETYFFENVVGFLKKPVKPVNLCKVLNKLITEHTYSETTHNVLPILTNYSGYIYVKGMMGDETLYFSEILLCKANGNYIEIVKDDHKSYLQKTSLKKIVDQFPANEFARISKNMIISLSKIKSKKGNIIELVDKSNHIIGPEYIEQFELQFNLKFAKN